MTTAPSWTLSSRTRIPARRGADDPITTGAAVAGALAWVVLFTLAYLVEPPPADPDAVPTLLESVFASGLALGLVATAHGLATRRRWGFGAGIATAGILGAAVAACPVTGHHTFAGWWFAQAAIVVALGAVSVAGWRRAPRAPR